MKRSPVSNVDLGVRLLQLIDDFTLTLRWVKVPSHTVICLKEFGAACYCVVH